MWIHIQVSNGERRGTPDQFRAQKRWVPTTGKASSVADGAEDPLSRDPARSVADIREQQKFPRLSASLARLGGRDLGVYKDNIENLAKRSPSEGSEATYNRAKRVRANRRLREMEKQLSEATSGETTGRLDMTQMILLFRQYSERKETADAKPRREERDAKEDAAAREREEQERVRRENMAAAEAQRRFEIEAAKLAQEERLRLEAA
ncbi:hypothetical protein PHYPSEUDO_012666 [Phytophthora pseudosyringae]|uniref:Uncharacterized protein n=1 Tax=Phytophthora pseudosyringae TaxID=221518 RepID=A0A8T1VBC4_9STRA|nr:hypothetical protein PHYPSEUDO_012666 [Phytophthora pseudosyringae]